MESCEAQQPNAEMDVKNGIDHGRYDVHYNKSILAQEVGRAAATVSVYR